MNIHKKIGYDNSKFEVIDNGFSLSEINFDNNLRVNFRKKYEIDDQEFIFGMVARWDPQKDFDNLMKSIKLYFEKNENSKVRFFLAGPNIQQSNKDLLNLIDKKIKNKVVLLGNFTNIVEFMNGIDCHVLSSAGNEGFPNVIGEAMACGLPCISTDVGDVSKLLFDNQWIVPVKDPYKLCEKMEKIYRLHLTDSSEVSKIKEKNRSHILKNFEISKTINSYRSSWFGS
tara:strand:- start:42 stop:725 length:684 start_codon:yes stop_codon:yes gene_type:complete